MLEAVGVTNVWTCSGRIFFSNEHVFHTKNILSTNEPPFFDYVQAGTDVRPLHGQGHAGGVRMSVFFGFLQDAFQRCFYHFESEADRRRHLRVMCCESRHICPYA